MKEIEFEANFRKTYFVYQFKIQTLTRASDDYES